MLTPAITHSLRLPIFANFLINQKRSALLERVIAQPVTHLRMSELQNWSPINQTEWSKVPFVQGRVATEADVQSERAVFYVDGEGHSAINMDLPRLAIQTNFETCEKIQCVIIQAENVDNQKLVGVRYFAGGNGICSIEEVEFVDS